MFSVFGSEICGHRCGGGFGLTRFGSAATACGEVVARKIENGGSLTILATALTETGSKMDEVIFEEFKGTGNMELQLDRKISNRRIYPAIDVTSSSTRREDLLLGKDLTQKIWVLRNHLADMTPVESIEFMRDRLLRTETNEEFIVTMNS